MSIFEDTNPRALKDLLVEAHSHTMALPDFQRDFVWEPGATQELIVSIANNYPAGSILRVRDANRVFAAREFEGAPSLNGQKHTFLVLDGQQRLTSLYQASSIRPINLEGHILLSSAPSNSCQHFFIKISN